MEEYNDSPLRWKLQFEGDVFEHGSHFEIVSNADKLHSALYDIFYIARNVLKHGDGTVEELEDALEKIKDKSWFVTDM